MKLIIDIWNPIAYCPRCKIFRKREVSIEWGEFTQRILHLINRKGT